MTPRPEPATAPDLVDSIRSRLDGAKGPQFWRSLEELAETEEFLDYLRREFPREAEHWPDGPSRRQFLRLMGASLALAGVGGLGGCAVQDPNEKIVPYVRQPEEIVLGEPLYFATALPIGGHAAPVLVESHEGRPTKVEGNPEHPASLGATDAFAQAEVLSLYDPDRSQVVMRYTYTGRQYLREIGTWDAFLAEARPQFEAMRATGGAGLRLLTETVLSPTLAGQIRDLLKAYPKAVWHQYDPVGRHNARAGAVLAFGEDVAVRYRVERADRILALDADFLACGPGNLANARGFASRRQVGEGAKPMNRLYVVESMPSSTGAMADHRLRLRSSEIGAFAWALARELGVAAASEPGRAPAGEAAGWIKAVAADLKAHKGSSLVIVGEGQPAAVHALAHAINDALGNVGATVDYTEPIEEEPTDQLASLRELVRAMDAKQVETLVILGGNPVYSAPADVKFGEKLAKVARSVHLSRHDDETSILCRWHIPETHALEAWGDARTDDGLATIVQPLIAPLYAGKSAHELISALMGEPTRSGYDIVRDYWKNRKIGDNFEVAWRTAVHDGWVRGSGRKEKAVALKATAGTLPPTLAGEGLEVVFRPDPTIYDGRFANNGWLQELPKPITKLTWDNAALLSPTTADRLKVSSGDMVVLRYKDRAVRAPVWVTPGHADESVTVHLGYGRTRAGRVGEGAGFNAYELRTSDTPDLGIGLTVEPLPGERRPLASTQMHRMMELKTHGDAKAHKAIEGGDQEGRAIVRYATLEHYREHPHFAHEYEHHEEPAPDETLYPSVEWKGYGWGMAINLNSCVGCNACVVACQAENNIPVVGKDGVLQSREMQWLEIDRYFEGDLDDPKVHLQPRLCMHCENAPCELVCPVEATLHDNEGLNVMVYNRCVGTRYCGNNCPYKVRHFNYFDYNEPLQAEPTLKMLKNPDVTVRARGVMEKCTYCTQRITQARIKAQEEGRTIRDGEFKTACQQACPTRAIVFGDVHDRHSEVSTLKRHDLNYSLLGELNTRPRTTYLAKVLNPNPDLQPEGRHGVGSV